MSRTEKTHKRTKYHLRGDMQADTFCTVLERHSWGSTEKILRRNRKTWTRLGNKRRRQADKEVISVES